MGPPEAERTRTVWGRGELPQRTRRAARAATKEWPAMVKPHAARAVRQSRTRKKTATRVGEAGLGDESERAEHVFQSSFNCVPLGY